MCGCPVLAYLCYTENSMRRSAQFVFIRVESLNQRSISSQKVSSPMSRNRRRRGMTRNEKIFYGLSLLIVLSMVLSLVYVALTPSF